jgi:FSR family fosmidomycin resistance protein-like MFS transporter
MKKYFTLGIGHCINDCIAGFIIGSLFYQHYTPLQLGIFTLLYNILAFGGQLAIARLVEVLFLPKKYLLVTFVLLLFSLLFLKLVPGLAILFSGIASALFHVTGGMEATRADDRSIGIGIFASPGIVGLIAGGWLAYVQLNFIPVAIVLCVAFILAILFFYQSNSAAINQAREQTGPEKHDIVMVVLITVISLRSCVWDIVQLVQQGNYRWLMIIAIAAMCGKIAGSFLADKIGHKRYSLFALLIAVPFLTILKRHLLALCIGVFLLQSTIPATTVMILQQVKRRPGVAISLSFGVSVFIAILLFYSPVVKYMDNNIIVISILFMSVALLWWYGNMKKKMRN